MATKQTNPVRFCTNHYAILIKADADADLPHPRFRSARPVFSHRARARASREQRGNAHARLRRDVLGGGGARDAPDQRATVVAVAWGSRADPRARSAHVRSGARGRWI